MDVKQSLPGVTLKHLLVFLLVAIWTVPTMGLLVSSVRDKDQLTTSGWWSALTSTQQNEVYRLPKPEQQIQKDDQWLITQDIFSKGSGKQVIYWGTKPRELDAYTANQTIDFRYNSQLTVTEYGQITWQSQQPFDFKRAPRIFLVVESPPRFSLDNYKEVLQSEGVGRAFINTFTVTLPATFIPIMIAAFAAYALAWMRFKGRMFFLAMIIGLIVVPLQMSLIPVLQVFATIGQAFNVPSKSYLTIWLAHTGFGLPLAIYLLRNYMASLPRDLIESAYMDGATHFQIFIKLILPLSMPALASFTIFQFLWVWNDLLVAAVFLGQGENKTVMTQQLVELLGSRGDNWEILTSGAFISIVVPIIVFLSMQKYFVRGLLAGSVKGG